MPALSRAGLSRSHMEPHVTEIRPEGMSVLCVALGKSPNLPVPQFLVYKIEVGELTS